MKKSRLATALLLAMVAIVTVTAGCGSGGATTTKLTTPATTATPASTSAVTTGKKVLVVIADKTFEDTEYSATRQALTAAGYDVVVANSSGNDSVGLQGTIVKPDTTISGANAADYRGVVLIGGTGVEAYFNNAKLENIARKAAASGETVAAICMAPVVLANAGLLSGRKATSSTDEQEKLKEKGATVQNVPVVVDGKIVTGRDPVAATEFGAAVVKSLNGQ